MSSATRGGSKALGPGAIFVGFALYEALAQDVNESTGFHVLPSFAGWVERRSWRELQDRLFPKWGPTAAFAATGLAISTARSLKKKKQAAR